MPRKLQSASISFGLVTIPVELFTAVSEQDIHFHQVHAKCGSRIKQQLYCPTCERVVERHELVKGYEVSKDTNIVVTQEELDRLEAAASDAIEILQFVPLSSVDPIFFENTYYLGPASRGEKAYHLLAQAMQERERVALARFVWRGKENIYLIRPAKGGLLLHRMYYADEVRDFGEIPKGNPEVNDQEMKLAMQLIDSISQAEFKPESFHDSYRQRVLEMIETKTQGRSVAVEPKAKPAPVVNLMDALKRSLEHHEVGKKEQARPVAAPADRTPRKKAHAGRK